MSKSQIPKHLSPESRKFWKALVNQSEIGDAAGLKILRVALESFDRAQAARQAIDQDGLTMLDKNGQKKAHPLLPVERDSRAAFLAGLKALNLDLEPLKDMPGRPRGTKNAK